MKFLSKIFITLLLFFCFQTVYADNTIKTGDIDKSEIKIVQGDQSTEQPASNNKITAGNILHSKVEIDQGSLSASIPPKPTPWWNHFFNEIITGIIALFFGLLLWYLKRRFGDTHD
ncbi:MAG: hypothetical protein U9R66_12420 [Thermodesulfobacteriota bacterium]|nr:hypothetical protein [Thermodesulfobacteriota bacterium]